MGAVTGSLAATRYTVDTKLPEEFRTRYPARLSSLAITPLDPDGEEERATGWAVFGHHLDTDLGIEKLIHSDYLCVTFRIDTLKVPPGLLRAHQVKAEQEHLAEHGKESVSREERQAIRDEVRRRLRRGALPNINGIDLLWNLSTGRVWVWSRSRKVLDEVEELFEKTFGLGLDPEDPFSTALKLGLSEGMLARLDDCEPADWRKS